MTVAKTLEGSQENGENKNTYYNKVNVSHVNIC